MTKRIDNARGLYLEAIRNGRPREALEKYLGVRYTQHSTGVADGADGFLEFFEPFLERNPRREMEIVRIFEDGYYVFVHCHQSLNGGAARWVTTDLFDTDEQGRIVEHWDTISAYVETSVSGHTMIDGETEIRDLEHTVANKELVRDFLRDVLLEGNLDHADRYVSAETYIQHNPQVADGLEGMNAFLRAGEASGKTVRYDYLFKVVGQGNFVASLSRARIGAQQMAIFDIFRLECGKIVEHWDNMEPIAPRETWKNSGKF